MRATMHPIVIERIPAPVNKASASPYAIHITQADMAIRNNIINDTRVIFWDINVFFASRLNPDIIINFNFNLVIAIQIAVLVSDLAHALHRIHHVSLLHFNGFAKLICPCGILCKLAKYIRERD